MLSFWRNRSTTPPPASKATGELLDPRVMQEIGQLELLSRTVVDGLLAGKHRSTTKGGCCVFAQHRQYSAGDEIRQIDWQVYARTDRYFVRQFEEETNLQTLIAVDATGSMNYRGATISKLDYARRTAACLARLLLHQRDAVGLAVLQEPRAVFVPPRQHAAHLRAVLSVLETTQAKDGGAVGAQIRTCIPRLRRRGLFILLTDGLSDLADLGAALRIVRARGHDVILLQILAPEELDFPFRHWSAFQSLEVQGERLRIDPASIRAEYLDRLAEHLDQLVELTVGLGGDYARMTTDQDLGEVLGWFLRQRLARGG
ncbi:DUF58 domain-containing protein [bacterium]|nr:DUF58 domain-containing protein [bacterium]